MFVDLLKSQTPKDGAHSDEHLGVERTSSPKQKHIVRLIDDRLIDRKEGNVEGKFLGIDRVYTSHTFSSYTVRFRTV